MKKPVVLGTELQIGKNGLTGGMIQTIRARVLLKKMVKIKALNVDNQEGMKELEKNLKEKLNNLHIITKGHSLIVSQRPTEWK